MVNEAGGISELGYLILGTTSMLLMMLAIISFVIVFQRKMARKAKDFLEIEKLMQKQELRSVYKMIEGQEQERKRIAEELHDNIGSLMATLRIYSDLVISKTEPLEIKRLNYKINQISTNLADEVRRLSHELDLRTLSGFGLQVGVEHLCEAISLTGKMKVKYIIDIQRQLPEPKMIDLYRIIQEMFTNTLKHANASNVRLEITQIDEELTVIFEDDGQGFDTATVREGMGMQNIRSRVNRMDGKLTLDSNSKGSTYIIELNGYE